MSLVLRLTGQIAASLKGARAAPGQGAVRGNDSHPGPDGPRAGPPTRRPAQADGLMSLVPLRLTEAAGPQRGVAPPRPRRCSGQRQSSWPGTLPCRAHRAKGLGGRAGQEISGSSACRRGGVHTVRNIRVRGQISRGRTTTSGNLKVSRRRAGTAQCGAEKQPGEELAENSGGMPGPRRRPLSRLRLPEPRGAEKAGSSGRRGGVRARARVRPGPKRLGERRRLIRRQDRGTRSARRRASNSAAAAIAVVPGAEASMPTTSWT